MAKNKAHDARHRSPACSQHDEGGYRVAEVWGNMQENFG